MTYTTEMITKIGGREWTGPDGSKRIYVNNVAELAGLELFRYGTGNISGGRFRGDPLSNKKLSGIDLRYSMAKVWLDTASGELHSRGLDAADEAYVFAAIAAKIAN